MFQADILDDANIEFEDLNNIPIDENKVRGKVKEFSAMGKKKRRTEPSQASKTISKISKLKTMEDRDLDFNEFKNKFGSYVPIENPSENEYQYFYQNFLLSEKNRKLTILRQLCSVSFKCFSYATSFSSNFITTDELFWCYVFTNGRPVMNDSGAVISVNTNQRAINLRYFKGIIKKIQMSSSEYIKFEEPVKYNEMYIQDNSIFYSSPCWPSNFQYNNEDVELVEDGYFFKNGQIYSTWNITVNNGKIPFYDILKEKNNVILDIKSFSTNFSLLKVHEKRLQTGFKEVSRKKGSCYFNKTIDPTSFCPSTLGPIPMSKFLIMCEYEINPANVYDVWSSQGVLKYGETILNMENIVEFLDFLVVMNLLHFNYFVNYKNLTDLLDDYEDKDKSIIKKVRSYYMQFSKCCVYFFDSFVTHPSVERMDTLKKKAEVTLRYRNLIDYKDFQYFGDIATALESFGNQPKLFFEMRSTDLIENIIYCCNLITTTKPEDGIDQLNLVVRSIGLKIFNMMANNKDYILNVLRSPSSFIMNIVGDQDPSELEAFYNALYKKVSARSKGVDEDALKKTRIQAQKDFVLQLLEQELPVKEFNVLDKTKSLKDLLSLYNEKTKGGKLTLVGVNDEELFGEIVTRKKNNARKRVSYAFPQSQRRASTNLDVWQKDQTDLAGLKAESMDTMTDEQSKLVQAFNNLMSYLPGEYRNIVKSVAVGNQNVNQVGDTVKEIFKFIDENNGTKEARRAKKKEFLLTGGTAFQKASEQKALVKDPKDDKGAEDIVALLYYLSSLSTGKWSDVPYKKEKDINPEMDMD